MHACDFILDVFCNGKPVQLLQEEGVTVSGDDGVAVKMSLAAVFNFLETLDREMGIPISRHMQ